MTALNASVAAYLAPRGAIREVVLKGGVRGPQARLALYASSYLQRQLRCDRIGIQRRQLLPELSIALPNWQHERANLLGFDRLFDQLSREGEFRLELRARDWLEGIQPALELLHRYQSLLPLPLDYTPLPRLQELLNVRRLLFEGRDERRGEHTWRWLLRLNPQPPRAVELAALFHDVLWPEPDDATRAIWSGVICHGFAKPDLARMVELSSQLWHGEGAAADLPLLRDARDLCFFSRESWRYFHERGHAPTRQQLELRLGRMSARAVCLALATRQPPDVSLMMDDILDERSAPDSGVRCA